MEESRLRFGVLSFADVNLWLMNQSGENYERNPLHLYSAILERSEYFKVKMSERWSLDQPNEIRVTTTHKFDDYLKCIQVMYGERVYLTSVEECLVILSVASELLADGCIKKCIQFWEAVRWSAEQETQIQVLLSSLGLKLLPKLAARLDKEDISHKRFLEKTIKEMMSVMLGRRAPSNRQLAEKFIGYILEGNMFEDVVAVCECELLKEFKSAICTINCSIMMPLFEYIKHRDGEILKAAFVAFVEDQKFTTNVIRQVTTSQSREVVLSIIIWFISDFKSISDFVSRNMDTNYGKFLL